MTNQTELFHDQIEIEFVDEYYFLEYHPTYYDVYNMYVKKERLVFEMIDLNSGNIVVILAPLDLSDIHIKGIGLFSFTHQVVTAN